MRGMERHPLSFAIETIGLGKLGAELRVSGQAIRKWEANGRLPRTEWTGETRYAEKIERLMEGEVTKAQLLAKWPDSAPSANDASMNPAPEAA